MLNLWCSSCSLLSGWLDLMLKGPCWLLVSGYMGKIPLMCPSPFIEDYFLNCSKLISLRCEAYKHIGLVNIVVRSNYTNVLIRLYHPHSKTSTVLQGGLIPLEIPSKSCGNDKCLNGMHSTKIRPK